MKLQLTILLAIFSFTYLAAQIDFIDSSFAINGSYILDYHGTQSFDKGIKSLVQADQKIIVGGTVSNGPFNDDIYLMRLNTDGTLDPTFGNNGEAIISFNDEEYLVDMIFTANEDIIVMANIGIPGFGRTMIYKVNNSGILDNSFGTSNAHTFLNPAMIITDNGSISLQSNGQIITVNGIGPLNGEDLQITRFNSNGTLDSTFGTNGMVIEDYGSNHTYPSSFLVDHNDFILVGGVSNSLPFLTRYTDNGVFDTTFADNGSFTFPSTTYYSIRKIGLDNANKHYIVGIFEVSNLDTDYELMQLQLGGQLDSAFGNNGYLLLDFGGDDRLKDFEYNADNNLILIGRSRDTSSYYQLLTSIDVAGVIDTTFGDNGVIKVDFEQGELINNMALQNDGKILLTGYTLDGSHFDIFVGRIFKDLLSNTKSVIELSANLSIFPNPTTHRLQFQLNNSINQNASISIFDLTGRQVFFKNIVINNGHSEIFLPKNILNSQYIVRLESENFLMTKRLIVIR